MDARLILNDKEEAIANALDTSVDKMYVELSSEVHEGADCIERKEKFFNSENEKFVLDLFNIYSDVQETIADEIM